MGYTTGEIAIRVKNGGNPADIPIQSMSKVRIHLNLSAAERQGIVFADEFLNKADEILESEENSRSLSDS